MTTPAVKERPWSTQGLRRLATAFVAQEHEGILGGLLLRIARYMQGDPSSNVTTTAAFGVTTQLPDDVRALSAVLHVQGAPVFYRTDGQNIAQTEPVLQPGTVVILTGQPTIKGFRFASAGAAAATLNGAYFD